MLRDDVLLLLTEAEGYLSGEEMREKLGVSRAAVSQAVRALRADGYDIDAVTNRGYCLRARPDTLTAGDVLSYLPEARRAMVRCFAQIDSTNSYLKAEAMRGAPDGLCAIADRQTAGRGRAGRPFRSDAGQGVYLSMLLRPNCAPTAAMTMTAHVAVAVCRALEACGVQPGIKWTNDLVLGTKKLCGILTELTVEAETGTVDSIVAGIGVNVRQRPEDFPPELRAIAGSVRSETGLEISRARISTITARAVSRSGGRCASCAARMSAPALPRQWTTTSRLSSAGRTACARPSPAATCPCAACSAIWTEYKSSGCIAWMQPLLLTGGKSAGFSPKCLQSAVRCVQGRPRDARRGQSHARQDGGATEALGRCAGGRGEDEGCKRKHRRGWQCAGAGASSV